MCPGGESNATVGAMPVYSSTSCPLLKVAGYGDGYDWDAKKKKRSPNHKRNKNKKTSRKGIECDLGSDAISTSPLSTLPIEIAKDKQHHNADDNKHANITSHKQESPTQDFQNNDNIKSTPQYSQTPNKRFPERGYTKSSLLYCQNLSLPSQNKHPTPLPPSPI